MHAWEAIQKSLDYIDVNISTELEIEQLAKVASLSPYYYQRLFSRLVKRPVMEYIKLRRLAHAYDNLNNKKLRILDIALECGFNSHATFTKAFKDAFGMTPEQFRENPVLLVQYNKPNLLLNYTMVDEGVPLISDGIILEFNRKTLDKPVMFMGVTGVLSIDLSGKTTGVDTMGHVWEKFHKEKNFIPIKPGGRTLDASYSWGEPEGHFMFFAGAEVEQDAEDVRFDKWQLPAREYIVCGLEAENFDSLVTDAIYKAWNYSNIWLKKHGLRIDRNACSPEIYCDSSTDGTYMEIWLAATPLNE